MINSSDSSNYDAAKFIAPILKEILLENDNLSIYWEDISVGYIKNPRGYIETYQLKFLNREGISSYPPPASPTSIRISNFRLNDISTRSFTDAIVSPIYSGSDYYGDANMSFLRNIYNQHYRKQTTLKRTGINIYRNIKLKGYKINFKDVKKLILSDKLGKTSNRIHDVIQEFYYIGDKNILIGFVTVDSICYIRQEVLLALRQTESRETIKEILRSLLNCFSVVDAKFTNHNIRTIEDQITNQVSTAIENQLFNGKFLSYYGIGSIDEFSPDRLTEIIENKTRNIIKKIIKPTIFGVNDSYSYSKILDDILRSSDKREKKVFNDGFVSGMKIGLKLEMLGWRITKEVFANSKSFDMWWEKDVEITPEFFYYGNERYKIPQSDRCFTITKLYINQLGKMRCKGDHPNVQQGVVCMGDLIINFAEKESVLSENLSRAETLLDIINYDSAYHKDKLQQYLKVSEKTTLYSNDPVSSTKKSKSTSIRTVSFDDCEDEDEPEESPKEPNKDGILKINISDDISLYRVGEEVVNEPTDYDEQVQTVFNNNIATYITPMLDDSQLRSVNEEGVNSPLLYIAATTETLPVIYQQNNNEEIYLGDNNVL